MTVNHGVVGSSPTWSAKIYTIMKRIIPKCYFDKARQIYPNEKDETRLMDIAILLKITMNSCYGKCTKRLLAHR